MMHSRQRLGLWQSFASFENRVAGWAAKISIRRPEDAIGGKPLRPKILNVHRAADIVSPPGTA